MQIDEKNDNAAKDVLEKMLDAYDRDIESNKQGKPGLMKLMISNEIFTNLRKKDLQELFLDRGGLSAFSKWLSRLPDGTFPNYNLVEGVLYCLDGIKMNENSLENSDLLDVIKNYSEGHAKMPALQKLAKTIEEKWNRQVRGVQSNYSKDFDNKYRVFQA